MQKQSFLIGIFDDEQKLVDSTRHMVGKNYKIHEIYTPFPVHGLDDLMGVERSRLPYVTFLAGGTGLLIGLLGQVFVSSVSWPINVGGKAFASIPAFIPIIFELTVLIGALSTVAAFFYCTKLFPGKKVQVLDKRQTDDKFIMALEKIDLKEDDQTVMDLLKNQGAVEVMVKEL